MIEGTTGGLDSYSLLLTGPVAMAALAAPILASHLGISEGRALRRLTTGPGPIASGLDQIAARRLLALLSTFGMTVRLRPDHDSKLRYDLSVQKAVWAKTDIVSAQLAVALARDPAHISCALDRPGGLMLCDLGLLQAREIGARLARIRGAVVLQTEQEGAIFDLFPPDTLTRSQKTDLFSALRSMGMASDPVTGACATSLNRLQRDHLLGHLPDFGLLALDRRFQRFDLYLTEVQGWVTRDLADFLAVRTGQPRARFEVISSTEPLLIDHGLAHAALRQFRTDYASIGLSTRALLRGLSRFPENPLH